MTLKEPRKGRGRGDHTVLREPGTQFIKALIPFFLKQPHHQCMMSFQPA